MSRGCGPDDAAILAGIAQIARTVFQDPLLDLTLETASEDVPGWDSMNHIMLVVAVECRFGIRFDAAETEDLRTVGALVRLVRRKGALVHA
ncbi:MAG: acyl carrier protein [Acetobacteraceae bacterium]